MALTERYVTTTGAGAHDGTSEGAAWSWAEMIAAGQPAAGYRVNVKAGTYDLSGGAVTLSNAGPWVLQGYTTTIGDGGKATLSFGATTGDFFTVSGVTGVLVDLIFASTASSGGGDGVRLTASGTSCIRCAAYGWRNNGFETATADSHLFLECEAYDCNKDGTAAKAGFNLGTVSTLKRCISHHNDEGSDVDCHGFYHINTIPTYIDCIAHANSGHGFFAGHRAQLVLYDHCDAYLNALDGFHSETGTNTASCVFENCNSIDNGGDGWDMATDGAIGWLDKCGDYSNANRTAGNGEFLDQSAINYSAVPYSDVDGTTDADFTLDKTNGALGRGTARHSFTTTGYTTKTTTGSRDVGASSFTPDFPAVGNVHNDDTVNEATGTLTLPTAAQVENGVTFGAGGTEFTGTLSAGGGGLIAHAGMTGGMNG